MSNLGKLILGLCLTTAVILLSVSSIAGGEPIRFKETRTTNVAHAAETGLAVHSDNGGISVIRSDRTDVEIIAYLKCTTEERLKEVQVVAERTADKTLKVYVKWPGLKRKNNEGCSFEILIPSANGVELYSANGEIICEGLSGEAVLRTSNGRISVANHAGPVDVVTSNGRIDLADITGRVHATTSNGAIDARNIEGMTEMRTSNGAIKAVMIGAPVNAHTSNGAISLELKPTFVGEFTASTSQGSLDIAGIEGATLISSGKNKIIFSIGASGQKSSASTSNGSLRIIKAD